MKYFGDRVHAEDTAALAVRPGLHNPHVHRAVQGPLTPRTFQRRQRLVYHRAQVGAVQTPPVAWELFPGRHVGRTMNDLRPAVELARVLRGPFRPSAGTQIP